jgi:hypothetical protein
MNEKKNTNYLCKNIVIFVKGLYRYHIYKTIDAYEASFKGNFMREAMEVMTDGNGEFNSPSKVDAYQNMFEGMVALDPLYCYLQPKEKGSKYTDVFIILNPHADDKLTIKEATYEILRAAAIENRILNPVIPTGWISSKLVADDVLSTCLHTHEHYQNLIDKQDKLYDNPEVY